MITTFNSSGGLFTAAINGINSAGTPLVRYGFDMGNTFMEITPATPGQAAYRVRGGFSDSTTHTCEYTSDLTGKLTISLKKWMQIARTKATPTVAFRIDTNIGGTPDVLQLTLNVLKGISYNDLLSPISKGVDELLLGNQYYTVVPPNVMLMPTNSTSIFAESSYGDISLFGSGSPVGTWKLYDSLGGDDPLTPLGERNNEIEIPDKAYSIGFNDGTTAHFWQITHPEACTQLVTLRWTSLTGATRQHAFYFRSLANNVEDKVGLVSTGDGFKLTKNVSNGFTIFLSGLTPYSVWYYNDMFNASDLHASIDSTGLTTEQTLVEVQGSAVVTPNGPGLFLFEATLKYRHYDTF